MLKVRASLLHLLLAGKVAECSFQLSKFQDGNLEVLLILSHCVIYLSTDTELRYAQSISLLTLFPCSGVIH